MWLPSLVRTTNSFRKALLVRNPIYIRILCKAKPQLILVSVSPRATAKEMFNAEAHGDSWLKKCLRLWSAALIPRSKMSGIDVL